jgi:hypothetical protein
VGDARARGQHPTDDQNGGEREQTVEIVGRQNTKRQATIANLIIIQRLVLFIHLSPSTSTMSVPGQQPDRLIKMEHSRF